MKQLAQERHLDQARLWQYLRTLVDRVVTAVDRDTFLDECLDMLLDLFGADRGLILLGDASGATFAVNARGKQRALTPYEREEISRTVIQQVQRTGQSLLWEPELGGHGPASMAALGIVSALAAPLRPVARQSRDADQFTRGVVYLDFRDAGKEVGELHREFLETAASLISVVLEQSQKLQLTREDLRAALARDPVGGPPPSLDELLRPRSMEPMRRELEAALHGDLPIVLLGESGTGKTLLARAIAEASGRLPLVRAMLGASDDMNTIASELFGHEKGAYSGALTRRVGLVEFADQGTLILDEILNLPAHAQRMLLDFTQFGTYRPLGHDKPEPKRSRVRLIAATNGDMEAAVRDGRFREDLYYRLSGVTLVMPPLRWRREDAPALAESWLRRHDPDRDWKLAVAVRRMLLEPELPWPGNIRQLETVIARARGRALARDPSADTIEAEHLEPRDLGLPGAPRPAAAPTGGAVGPGGFDAGDLGGSWRLLQVKREQLDEQERRILETALDKHDGVVARAARELDMARTSLVSRLNTLKVKTGDSD